MENHDKAYQIWREAGWRERILVHIDAHDDLGWIQDHASINIGTYICPALKDGIVREVFWVVPDQTWRSSRALKPVLRRLKKIIKAYPGDPYPIHVGLGQIATAVLGKPLKVCTLANLPGFAEEVLLDIDVDYLVIPRAGASSDQHRTPPWCWPADLIAGLAACDLRPDLVTIAYSVEGGYTPLKWKYLGDELAERLGGPTTNLARIRGMELMREGALAAHQGDRGSAEAKYLQARALLPDCPAPDYHLAHLYADLGRHGAAQEHHQRALALDSSYRTPYNSGGIWYYSDRRYAQADREHRRTLAMNPEDAHAQLGLGQLAAHRKQWHEAETWARKALQLHSQLVDAYRLLGKVLVKQGCRPEAISAYEKSLQLSLSGHKPLEGPILTDLEDPRLLDPDHFRIHLILARLYELQGETDTAITGYRMGIAAGCDGFEPRIRLAHLYLKRHQWQTGAWEAWQAVKMVPRDLQKTGRRLWRSLRKGLRARFRRWE